MKRKGLALFMAAVMLATAPAGTALGSELTVQEAVLEAETEVDTEVSAADAANAEAETETETLETETSDSEAEEECVSEDFESEAEEESDVSTADDVVIAEETVEADEEGKETSAAEGKSEQTEEVSAESEGSDSEEGVSVVSEEAVSESVGTDEALSVSDEENEEENVDNELTATQDEDNTIIYIPYNESLELTFDVSALDMTGITYEWYGEYFDGYYETEGPSLTLDHVTQGGYCHCRVTDKYNNMVFVGWTIYVDTGLAYSESSRYEYTVNPGDNLELTANATTYEGLTLSYQWRSWTYGFMEEIEGETEKSYSLENITSSAIYSCVITDSVGYYLLEILYYVTCDNELTIEDYVENVYVVPGDSAELTVIASVKSGGLSYQWKKYDDESGSYNTLAESSNSLETESITETGRYRCTVSDDYGSTQDVYFYVYPVTSLTLMYLVYCIIDIYIITC